MHAPQPCHSGPPRSSLLIYDGQCRLCVGVVEGLRRAGAEHDRSEVRLIPYQSAEAVQALGARYRVGVPTTAWLVSPSGEARQGLEAFFPLLRTVPGGAVVQWLLRQHVIRSVAERSYHWLARNRYRWFGAVSRPESRR